MDSIAIARGLLLLGALVVSAQANAQAVYRCEEKGKPVSFQTAPCPASAKVTGIKEFTPDRELTWQEKQARDARWATRGSQPGQARGAVMPVRPAPAAVDHCAAARAGRDQWERTVGLNRTFEGLRAWNERVARACN